VELIAFIHLGQGAPSLPFLIIGGYAVAAHGHTRPTFDVDFLVRQTDRERWIEKLTAAGINLLRQTRGFAQFSRENGSEALDLMLVNDATYEQFARTSQTRDFGGVSAGVPSLDNLLALKLHALKQGLPHRTSRDAEDVEMLARRNKIDLASKHYEELFLKYGSREIYETILRTLRKP